MHKTSKAQQIRQVMADVHTRAMQMLPHIDGVSLAMDLASAEKRVRPDWERLMTFDNVNFLHDLAEIGKNIDRSSFPGTFPSWFSDCLRCGKRSRKPKPTYTIARTPTAHE